ncbi:hypothetical protein [Nocardioides sp. TF02-7]|uniref:hypothetical protein n=1 Tax=Nocardioides sp. TF02-7 TaxID=2917724 RepID=UPI001F0673DA|nr:hypothetical protein [Nocardioides sp. TF02-7]UMG93264.1 hypothetical protein MF408_02945 [Nocardioides sp. TF02-7]
MTKRPRNPRTRQRRFGAAALLAVVLTVLGIPAAPTAQAAVEWNDGAARYTRVLNCPSVIWGSPYYENGIGAYAGHAVDLATDQPKVGEVFYVHVQVFGLGNPCAGTLVQPTFNLPAGASFARDHPIQCYVNGAGGNAPNNNCPGWDHLDANGAYYNRNQGDYPSVWPIPQGVDFEIRVPVRADRPHTGTNWSVTLWTADGNASPTLQLPATMFVFGAPQPPPDPKVTYPTPSTKQAAQTPGGQPTRYGLYSEFGVTDLRGVAGTLTFQLGTAANDLSPVASVPLQAGQATASAWTDWDEPGVTLRAGRTYYWRGVFDPGQPGGGDARSGPVQSFTVPGGGPGPEPEPDPDPEPQPNPQPNPQPTATCKGLRVTVDLAKGQRPTARRDVILGTPRAETIRGRGGDDVICGGGGKDRLLGEGRCRPAVRRRRTRHLHRRCRPGPGGHLRGAAPGPVTATLGTSYAPGHRWPRAYDVRPRPVSAVGEQGPRSRGSGSGDG